MASIVAQSFDEKKRHYGTDIVAKANAKVAAVIDILKSKGYLENYGKSVDGFEELQGHQAEAVQYAKERVERLSRDQVAVLCRDSNPVTTVYELVEFLNSKRI